MSLLNDARIRAGKPSLGFLNPLIYSINLIHTGAFNDITTGNNPGCGTEGFNVSARCCIVHPMLIMLSTGYRWVGSRHRVRYTEFRYPQGYCAHTLVMHECSS